MTHTVYIDTAAPLAPGSLEEMLGKVSGPAR
jgi:hypothetical protein